MSIRAIPIEASSAVEVDGQEYPEILLADIERALAIAASVLHLAGGYLTVGLRRIPSGLPNHYIAIEGQVVWQERTNARPQPEPDARLEARAEPVDNAVDSEPPPVEAEAPAEFESVVTPRPSTAPVETGELVDDVGDGLLVDPNAEDVRELTPADRERAGV